MYKNKNILVCGIGKSGISAGKLLNNLGGNVTLQDMKEKNQIPEAELLEKEGIKFYTGKNPDDIILNQDLIVLSPGVPTNLPFILQAEEHKIPVISEIELAFRHTPKSVPVIAITGTNGKTTTTTIVGEIMKEFYGNCEVVGNIGISYSGVVENLQEEQWIVAEISSFQMEKAVEFKPKISSVLNITPDHLNRHKTMENYIHMKERVFQNQNENDFTILNYDDKICREMANKTKGKVIFFSSKTALENGIYLDGDLIKSSLNHEIETIISVEELEVLGVHNYENIMASICICLMADVDLHSIKKVLRKFKGVPHRIEYVDNIKGVNYYNDSKATNVEAGICGILAMNRPTILIGGGSKKDDEFSEWVGHFKGKVKELILIGETAEKIKLCAEEKGFNKVTICGTMDKAVDLAYNFSEKGDCVLLSPACASFDMFKNFEKRGDYFKECVKKLPK